MSFTTPTLGSLSPASAATVAALAKLTLPVPRIGEAPPAPANDLLAPSQPPTADALWRLATTGLQQLAALLPTLERIAGEERRGPVPFALGTLARSVGEAAHAIEAGYTGAARLFEAGGCKAARPEPGLVEPWRQAAQLVLADASAQLDLVARSMAQQTNAEPAPRDVLWATEMLASAQRRVGLASASLARPPARSAARAARPNPLLALAAALGMILLTGFALLTATLGIAAGMIVGAAIGLIWSWRIAIAARGVRLARQRPR